MRKDYPREARLLQNLFLNNFTIKIKMSISVEHLKELREKTGAGVSDVKKALEESRGDMEKALKIIERKLGGSATKKAGRETKSGLIEAYVHSNNRVATLVEVFCETDFVARNPEFKELAHDLALHIAAMRPVFASMDMVPSSEMEEERARFREETKKLGKPDSMLDGIVEGKLKAHFGAMVLLEQPFVKEQNKTVGTVISEAIGRFGENIKIGKFVRFEI